jgi:Icc protein
MLIAQITDFHVVGEGERLAGGLDTAARLAATVARLNALEPRPDLVIATGDLVNDGRRDEYARLRDILAPLEIDLVLQPGNHDDPAQLAEAFPDHPYLAGDGGGINFVAADGPPRLVALDTVVPGTHGGFVDDRRLAWLDGTLGAAPDTPTVIAMHHPPSSTGLAAMDGMNCGNGGALAEVLAGHPQVERILCGHLHRTTQQLWNGILLSTAPATSFQVGLDLRPDAPLVATAEPAAFQLHLWRPDCGLISHICYVESFETLPDSAE